MATIQEIATAAGVSVATVSRAFHPGTVINEDTRTHILRIAEEAHYHPKNYRRRAEGSWRHSLVGVIIACNNYPWFNRISDGLCTVLEKENITPIFANTNENPQKDITCIDKLKDVVKGLIVVASTELDAYSTNFLAEINRTIPVVTMIRNANIPGIDSIVIEGFRPTYDAISTLIDNGHRHIGIINGPMIFKPSFDRFAAYTEALRAKGLPVRNEYVCYGSFSVDQACQLTEKLLRENPAITAIFAANTASARGCLQAFEKCGLKVPDDIALISYGDDFLFGLQSLRISVVSDPDIQIGRRGAQLLLERIRQPRPVKNKHPARIIVTPDIVFRGSEAFPKNRSSTSA